MIELLTAAQMRAVEAAAITSGEVTGLELMERAGRGVVEAIFEEWPELRAPTRAVVSRAIVLRAVVLCGPGNNGGDGFVVARLLMELGWEVEVFLYGSPEGMPPDARVNYEQWQAMGAGNMLAAEELWGSLFTDDLALVVDAIFGTGLTRAAPFLEPLDFLIHRVFSDGFWWRGEASSPRVVAIDTPSDRCCDSGRVLDGRQMRSEDYAAHLTVTFHRAKLGHYLGDAPKHCTNLKIVDIGLDEAGNESHPTLHQLRHGVFLVQSPRADFVTFQSLGKGSDGHKFNHGHALILSGGIASGGAARLAARGALRIGAGVVTLGCPPAALTVNAAQLNAIMVKAIAGADGLETVLEDERINALCLGPGLGISDENAWLLASALKSGRRLVLDADAITLLSRDASLFAMLHAGCVLTPHAGEFARLFPDIAAKLAEPAIKGPAYSKVDACREAAKRAGCVVVFKGPDTVIAAPDGRCSINAAVYDRAAPWLATAGSGDVLAGFLTGLLARGLEPMAAAETAAWLHVDCARSYGPGLIAEDLPEELPKVFRAMGL